MVQLQNLEDKRELRKIIMNFFSTPRLSRGMLKEPEIRDSGYSAKQVKQMVRSLDEVGLIHKVRGESSGSVYSLTDDGQILIDGFDLATRHAEDDDNRG